MKEKIKEVLYFTGAVLIILVLGFSPVEEKFLSLVLGNLPAKMAEAGVIDKDKFENLYSQRGGLQDEDLELFSEDNDGKFKMTRENSGIMLNMFWALGLGNKNPILLDGPMVDQRYGGAGVFASTGGWTLSKGDAMDHYGMHSFMTLTKEQQSLLEKVVKNIYRPCCDNSTHFPDCNHGMAMLGLLELAASQGFSKEEMYKIALEANTFWFGNQYDTIKSFLMSENIDWNTVSPEKILGAEYSSSSGFQKVLSQMKPQQQKGGTGCGV